MRIVVSALVALALTWVVFLLILVVVRPRGLSLREAKRLVPDIVRSLVLRSVVRRAGSDAIERHWKGSSTGLDVVRSLSGVKQR